MDAEIAKLEGRIQEAGERILTASKIEGRYIAVQREVTDIESAWATIVQRLDAAERRVEFDRYDSATPFQVLQKALPAGRPAKPDRLFTSFFGLVIGLGIGVGLAVARHRLDASYRQAEDLRALMPGAVLVTIPDVPASGVRVGRALGGIFAGLLLTSLFAATVAILGIQLGWWGEMAMIQPLVDLR
jgi:capsular polysaccharide biosynthesis protein